MKKTIITIVILLTFSIEMECQNNKIYSDQPGYTTIKGTIKNFNKAYDQFRSIEIQINDWTTSLRRQYFANIDSTGYFSISFYILNNQDVIFTYNNKWHLVFVNPNDTLNMSIDADNFPKGNKYQGKTAKTCSDYLKYWLLYPSSSINFVKTNNLLQNTLPPAEYKQWRDSVYYSDLEKVENYIRFNNFNDFLSNWIKNDIYLIAKSDVLGYYFRKPTIRNIDTLFINSINFEDSTLRYNSNNSGIINSTAVLLSMYSSKMNTVNNTILRPIQSSNVEENKPISKPRLSNEQFQILLFNNFIKTTGALNNNLFRQSVIAERYLSILEQQNIDVGLDSVLSRINDYRIKASVILRYNDYEFRKGNLNSLQIENPGSILLDKLISKFKGYVLFIDFWGTWCGPCYSQMKLMKDIEKELKNEKIAFIYLCCKCQKDLWEKTTKGLEGEHIFLTSEEYAFLSKRFNIISVPRNIIIDKNGKLVNDNVPYQMDKYLVNTLRNYLRN
jgi:thiol-disulfide isomerase/thioredoxin